MHSGIRIALVGDFNETQKAHQAIPRALAAAKGALRDLEDALRETRDVRFDGETVPCPVYQRERLDVGLTLRGPAILDQFDCTTVICAGQVARVDAWKNLIVTEEA